MRPELAERTSFLRRHAVASYFVVAFAISWMGALLVVAPKLLRGEPIPKMDGLLIFPAMLLGPSAAGVAMTAWLDGKEGVKELFRRVGRVGIGWRWYLTLLIAPLTILAVLKILQATVSASYTPHYFWIGILFGLPAGFLEELGWTGFAFPRMMRERRAAGAAVVLGLIWALWHLPATDYLGSATPHGAYLVPYFLAFACAMTAMRMLICWAYSNTKSVLLAQLMHVVSTGSLVVFSPAGVTARQEVMWYAVYAGALWVGVAVVLAKCGRDFCAAREVRGMEQRGGAR